MCLQFAPLNPQDVPCAFARILARMLQSSARSRISTRMSKPQTVEIIEYARLMRASRAWKKRTWACVKILESPKWMIYDDLIWFIFWFNILEITRNHWFWGVAIQRWLQKIRRFTLEALAAGDPRDQRWVFRIFQAQRREAFFNMRPHMMFQISTKGAVLREETRLYNII